MILPNDDRCRALIYGNPPGTPDERRYIEQLIRSYTWGHVRPGDRFQWRGGVVRVLAVADGYAMCRRPRLMPFVLDARHVAAALAQAAHDAAHGGGQ